MQQLSGYSEDTRLSDLDACRTLLQGGSKSFYAASFLLPKRVRDPATALYAFCRLADDAVDLSEAAGAVDALLVRLDAAYAGTPDDSEADRAFADTVHRHAIPKELPRALIEGFAWDKAGRTYETIDEVLDYAARVAGTVGAMMSLLMKQREPGVIARACDLGMAMQLTNIARDVGEDALAGRLYLPRVWIREAGLHPETWLKHPHFCPEIATVIRRLLGVAENLYERADAGISALPADCRPGITAARLLYSEIGRAVARQGWNSVDSRAIVSKGRKAELLVCALRGLVRRTSELPGMPLAAAQFLVDAAVAGHPSGTNGSASPAWWDVRGQLLFILDLFERLERRDRSVPASSQNYSMVPVS